MRLRLAKRVNLEKHLLQAQRFTDYSLGVALQKASKHHNSGNPWRILFTTRGLQLQSLTPTEQHYAQIEKEFLAIVEAFNKFDQWLLGKSDKTVHTDHQPLQSILQKDLASAPKRLQKMMLFLQQYNFTVAYRKGSSLRLADTLSRVSCRDEATTPSIPDTFQVFRMHLTQLDPTSPSLTDDTCKRLRWATALCQEIRSLAHYIFHDWPPTQDHLP